MVGDALRTDLVERLLEHCGHPSVTGSEAAIADLIERRYRTSGEHVMRVGDSLVVGSPAPERRTVLLVGHLDTVPPTADDARPREDVLADGTAVVVGRGASDMKAGNVVAMHLFEDAGLRSGAVWNLVLLLYSGEEGPAAGNELPRVLDAVPWLAEAALAIVLEPTDGQVELGCLGGIHARVAFSGSAAHSARPWQGRNALSAAGTFLAALASRSPEPRMVDGIEFRDVLVPTQAWTGGLGPDGPGSAPLNVVPDRFTVSVNLRFAPSRDLAAAEAELRAEIAELVGAEVGAEVSVEIIDRAPPAPPHRDDPAVRDFVAKVGAVVGGKQAWTDVARFTERGVPALNYGPGATSQAHRRGEWVAVEAMIDVRCRIAAFLDGGGA